MRYFRPIVFAILFVVGTSPVFAQRHPGGGPAPAAGGHGSGVGATNGNATSTAHAASMNASPTDVLSHNTAIAGKIKTLTGEDASAACGGFKTIGQCVAAAHVALNLNVPGGFDALKTAMTSGSGMSLGKAIQSLAPSANSKSESKKANKQAKQDLNASTS